VSPYVLEKLRQKDAPRIEAASQECEWRKQQQKEAKASEQARQEAAESERVRRDQAQTAERERQAREQAAVRERQAQERERQRQAYEALPAQEKASLPAKEGAPQDLSDATVCKLAIKSDRSGWVEGSHYAHEEASRRSLTFRFCDEMNNPPARVDTEKTEQTHSRPVPGSTATKAPVYAKTERDTVVDGIASTLFYDQHCKTLPPAFIRSISLYSQIAGISASEIMDATAKSQEAYDISPTLLCRLYKVAVEKSMAETHDVWSR
jgi:hypothetical protein